MTFFCGIRVADNFGNVSFQHVGLIKLICIMRWIWNCQLKCCQFCCWSADKSGQTVFKRKLNSVLPFHFFIEDAYVPYSCHVTVSHQWGLFHPFHSATSSNTNDLILNDWIIRKWNKILLYLVCVPVNYIYKLSPTNNCVHDELQSVFILLLNQSCISHYFQKPSSALICLASYSFPWILHSIPLQRLSDWWTACQLSSQLITMFQRGGFHGNSSSKTSLRCCTCK